MEHITHTLATIQTAVENNSQKLDALNEFLYSELAEHIHALLLKHSSAYVGGLRGQFSPTEKPQAFGDICGPLSGVTEKPRLMNTAFKDDPIILPFESQVRPDDWGASHILSERNVLILEKALARENNLQKNEEPNEQYLGDEHPAYSSSREPSLVEVGEFGGMDDPCSPNSVVPWDRGISEGTVSSTDIMTHSTSKKGSMKAARFRMFNGIEPYLDNIWQFLEDADSSKAALWYRILGQYFIIMTSCGMLMQTSLDKANIPDQGVVIFEYTIDIVFTLEIMIRFACCPTKTSVFVRDVYNIIDGMAPSVLVLRVLAGYGIIDGHHKIVEAFFACIVPTTRLCRILRHFDKFALLKDSFIMVLEALPVICFVFIMIALFFASAFYIAEDRENIESLPMALYLTVITMTTVGYGDITPKSEVGQLIAAVLATISGLYMAIPYGIIGQTFNHAWSDRDRLLVMHRTRQRLNRWGYSSRDIPLLFQQFDLNEDNELDVDEFRMMIADMGIGLSDDRAVELFKAFDADGSGNVDCDEFLSTLFPADVQSKKDRRESM